MQDLLLRPESFPGAVAGTFSFAPQAVGFDYLGFETRRVSSGQTWSEETGENELGLVVLGGRCSIRSTKGDWSNALVGRNVTFPGDDDPRAVASAVNGVVHKGWNAPEALNICSTFAARI